MKFSAWRYKRYHASYGIGVVSLGLLIGLVLSRLFTVDIDNGLVLQIALAIITVILLIKIRWHTFIILLVVGCLAGIIHGSIFSKKISELASFSGSTISLRGTIAEDPAKTSRGETRLIISEVVINSRSYDGSVWVSIRDENNYARGDKLTVNGKMKDGFGVYQLSTSYAKIISHDPSKDPLLRLRDKFASTLRSVVVEPAASLGIGFVIGQKSALPVNFEEQLRIVGLTHLVVASGYNLTILIRFAKRLFEKHSKFLVVSSSSFLIIGFMAISGSSPSMVRAGIVAGLSILAWSYGRKFHPMLLLLYVAALTAMIDPLYIWADVGWWLSFLAFFGVLILSPLFLNIFYKDHRPSALMQIVSESVMAQIITSPIIIATFGSIPALAVIANIVSAPLIPLAMLLTFVAGTCSMLLPWLAIVIAVPAEIILSYFVAVIRFLSAPEWSQIDVGISWQVLAVTYLIIAVSAVLVWKKIKYNFRTSSIVD